MHRNRKGFSTVLCVVLFVLLPASTFAQKRKVIVDQDARGPASTDMQSILMFLQSPDFEVLGITLVSGDQWVKEETQRTLRAVEIAGRTDVPVVAGAEFPLLNSREESEVWGKEWGDFNFRGAWSTPSYHAPEVIPQLAEGNPTIKALDEHAVNFIIRMVHKYPHEVTLWAGGPLTNYALAIRMDPELPSLAKELVLMGSGFNTDRGNMHGFNGRREFNWWFDPEAVRIVMGADWKKITITPHDLGVKARLTDEVKTAIAKAGTPVAKYHTQFARPGLMWDEVSVAAMIDPGIIVQQKDLFVSVDINHGSSYGQTIFVEKETRSPSGGQTVRQMPPWWKPATVQFDLDLNKFHKLYIDLMTRPSRTAGR